MTKNQVIKQLEAIKWINPNTPISTATRQVAQAMIDAINFICKRVK